MNMYGESSSDPFELKKLARLRISDVLYRDTSFPYSRDTRDNTV